MKCPDCGLQNPRRHRFCGGCGQRLVLFCVACGERSLLGMHFCGLCGVRLPVVEGSAAAPSTTMALPSRAAIAAPAAEAALAEASEGGDGVSESPSAPSEQERRLVSVLFTDMSGSTAMAETMDPEEFTGIVNELFAELGACITRYEGHIDKYIGDAIMATFGAPISHENDAERAVLAALDMQSVVKRFAAQLQKRTGVDLGMRVGINTGEVIAGNVGSEARAEYTVMGDTVNVASRLEHHAPIGGVLVSESTYRQTRAIFEWRVPDPITVKGKSEPLKVFEPLAVAVGHRGVRGVDWTETPHVGRGELVGELVGLYRQASLGSTQVFAVVADAGMGKSRLRHELGLTLEGDPTLPRPRQLVGRCLPYQQGTTYGAVSSLLADYVGLSPGEDPVRIGEQLAARGAAAETIDLLMPLLTGGRVRGALDRLAPEQWQRAAFIAVRELIENEAAIQPVILFFEDVHWVDQSSSEFLSYLLPALRDVPALVFLAYRPDFIPPAVWQAHPEFRRFDLAPLTPDQTRMLIRAIVPAAELPEPVLAKIVARAAGNPFYVEEILKSFVESGAVRRDGDGWAASNDIDRFEIPDSIQALLRTRLDRLEDRPRRVLQQAAVLGRRFTMALLAEVTDVQPLPAQLDKLVGLGFLNRVSDGPPAYSFPSLAAQEVAYSVLLVRRRRGYHRRTAEALERQPGDAVEAQLDDLARHSFLGEVWPKALVHGRRAADRARSLYANAEAVEQYGRCLTAIDRLEELLATEWGDHPPPDLAGLNRERLAEERLEILLGMGDIQALVGRYDEATVSFVRAEELAAEPARQAEAAWRLAEGVHMKRARWQDALEALTRGRELLASDSASPAARARLEVSLSQVYWRMQRLEDARAIAESCVAQLENGGYPAELARARKQLGLVEFALGNLEASRSHFEQGLTVARQTGDPREVMPILSNLGVVAFRQGRYDEATTSFQELLRLAEQTGDVWVASNALTSLGNCARVRGQLDEAIVLHERSARVKQRIGDPRGMMISYNNMAEVLGDKGEAARAIEYLDRSLAIARDVAARDKIPRILLQMAEQRLALGDDAEGERLASEGRAAAAAIDAKLELALNTRMLGRLWLHRKQADPALGPLQEALATFRAIKSGHEVAVTLLDVAEAEHARGAASEADAALTEAAPVLASHGTAAEKQRLDALRARLAAQAAQT